MVKLGADDTFYKYEEINLETYMLHKSENEKKPSDLNFSPQKRTKLPSAGDIWIPYTSHDPQKRGACPNDLIIQHARALAREGKRVTQAPSYLYDLRSFFLSPTRLPDEHVFRESGIIVHWCVQGVVHCNRSGVINPCS